MKLGVITSEAEDRMGELPEITFLGKLLSPAIVGIPARVYCIRVYADISIQKIWICKLLELV